MGMSRNKWHIHSFLTFDLNLWLLVRRRSRVVIGAIEINSLQLFLEWILVFDTGWRRWGGGTRRYVSKVRGGLNPSTNIFWIVGGTHVCNAGWLVLNTISIFKSGVGARLLDLINRGVVCWRQEPFRSESPTITRGR
jgi:hypothetical protein